MPGVTVSAQGVDATKTFTTETDGQYRFLNLAPGPYKVTAALQGFTTVIRENVIVSVGRNVELPMLYAGVRRKERRRRATELLERVGIPEKAKSLPSALSGGQRQRVAVARALANRPAMLLADEPTGALDSKTGHEVLELFTELHRQGNTILIVTHDLSIAALASRQVEIHDGRVAEASQVA